MQNPGYAAALARGEITGKQYIAHAETERPHSAASIKKRLMKDRSNACLLGG